MYELDRLACGFMVEIAGPRIRGVLCARCDTSNKRCPGSKPSQRDEEMVWETERIRKGDFRDRDVNRLARQQGVLFCLLPVA
jgi:hypothetical protein